MPLKLIRRKGSPHWWITGSVRGTRIRESTGTDLRARAEEARAAREEHAYRLAFHGAPAEQRRVAFSTAIISYIKGGSHSPATKARIGRLLDFFGPEATCDAITLETLDKACDALLRSGSKPATRLREVLTPARAVLTHAARRGWCQVPVLEPVAVSPARTSWLTPDELDRLVEAAAAHLKPLLTFLAGTGARLGEALALDWADVDLQHARATLRETKNGRDRIVELCPRVVAALAGMAVSQNAASSDAGKWDTGRDGPVFRTNHGKPYAAKRVQGGGQIKRGWSDACARAGLSGVSPHGLRHTWATWHYAMHRDLLALRTDGGWRTASQVERYAKLAPAGMVAEMRRWRGEPAQSGTILTRDETALADRRQIA